MIARRQDAVVDCGDCTACCRGQSVILQPDESPVGLRTLPATHPLTGKACRQLEHAENGDCVYLTAQGCGIYERRPKVCRAFSCVGLVLQYRENAPRAVRRRAERAGLFDNPVGREGIRRIEAGAK